MTAQQITQRTSSAPTILVLEDDAVLGRSYERSLTLAGFVTTWCGSEERARDALQQPFDAYLIDLNLDGWDGMRAVRRVRAERPTAAVMVVSGGITPSIAYELGRMQVAMLEKPVRLSAIVQMLELLLEGVRHWRLTATTPIQVERARYLTPLLSTALEEVGSVRKLARILGIDRAHLQRLLKTYGVRKRSADDDEEDSET